MAPRYNIGPLPLKHDISRSPAKSLGMASERGPVTVCVASLFSWNYGTNEWGRAAVTASDRQITAGDIEYEPRQVKICFLTSRVLLLIAGDYYTHSEALLSIQRRLVAAPETDIGLIAEMYASIIREINARHATQRYLAPLGLTQDSFLSRQHEFDSHFVARLTDQIQGHRGEFTEAIIVGGTDIGTQVYCVGPDSKVTYHDDIGFAAIGIGSWHAKSQLMRIRYTNQLRYATALAATYAAKKAAEIAPGVGTETDMFLVTRLGWEPVLPEIMTKIGELHTRYEIGRADLSTSLIGELDRFLGEFQAHKKNNGTPPKLAHAQIDSDAISSSDHT
jgi:hypothetical protein